MVKIEFIEYLEAWVSQGLLDGESCPALLIDSAGELTRQSPPSNIDSRSNKNPTHGNRTVCGWKPNGRRANLSEVSPRLLEIESRINEAAPRMEPCLSAEQKN